MTISVPSDVSTCGSSVINPASCFKPPIEAARVSAHVSVARSHESSYVAAKQAFEVRFRVTPRSLKFTFDLPVKIN